MTQPVPATTPMTGCNPTGRSLGALGIAPRGARLGREFWVPAVEETHVLHLVGSLGQRAGDTRAGDTRAVALARGGLTAVVALALCAGAVLAEEPSPESQARELAAEIIRETGNGGLGAWTRSIVDRALERAGATARETTAGMGTRRPAAPGRKASGADRRGHRRPPGHAGNPRLHEPRRAAGELAAVGAGTPRGRERRWCCAASARRASARP